MNVNLISPIDNGNKFNIRFKEDINIPANSKIYLNHATLSRKGAFELSNDQRLYIVLPMDDSANAQTDTESSMLPTRIPNAPATFNQPFDNSNVASAIISAGEYDYSSMLNAITTAINTILSRATNVANLGLYRAIEEGDLDIDYDDGANTQHDVAFGIVHNTATSGNPRIDMRDFTANADHTINMTVDGTTGAITKNNANKTDENFAARLVFDNYATSDRGYAFYNLYDSTPLKDINHVHFNCNKTYQQIGADNDALLCGLHSIPYAEGIYGTDGAKGVRTNVDNRERTEGNTQTNTRGGVAYYNPEQTNYTNGGGTDAEKNPIFPFSIVIDGRGATTSIKIRLGKNTRDGSSRILECAGSHINSTTISTKSLARYNIDPTQEPSLMFALYQTKLQASRPTSYYVDNPNASYMGIIVLNHDYVDEDKSLADQPANAVIYKNDYVFNYHYFTDVRDITAPVSTQQLVAYDNLNRIDSQTPFNVVCSALRQNTGFNFIVYSPLLRGGDNATKPLSFIKQYSILADRDLANQIGVQTITEFQRKKNRDNLIERGALERLYYPNCVSTDPNQAWGVMRTKFDLPWRRTGYSILLKNLPLQNYKNNDAERNGGFSKNILANIPAPFRNTNIEYNSKSRHLITATYEAPFKIDNTMKNQDLSINNFDVEIINSKTDVPATEILNSVINFTIEPPPTKQFDNTITNIKQI